MADIRTHLDLLELSLWAGLIYGYLEDEIQTPMARDRSTEIISMIDQKVVNKEGSLGRLVREAKTLWMDGQQDKAVGLLLALDRHFSGLLFRSRILNCEINLPLQPNRLVTRLSDYSSPSTITSLVSKPNDPKHYTTLNPKPQTQNPNP